MLKPKLIDALRQYSLRQLYKDIIAGLVVGVIALPLAIAFAIASGLPPEKGIYTAVIAGFLISLLGGSRVQIGGPTGAFVIIVAGILQQYGYHGLLIATLMAGVILVLFGLARLGAIIKFIPHSVIVGFTLGIALLIFTGQIGDFLGLGLRNLPADLVGKMTVIFRALPTIDPLAFLLGTATIAILLVCGRFFPRVPGALIALVGCAAAAYAFRLPVETIGSRFGSIPHGLPSPVLPSVSLETVRHLLNPAFTIAMLGAIESLLSAVVADGMIGGKHRSNMELIAQGVANIASPLFGGLPATGAIARTAANVRSGGRTPVAGIVHAVTLLAIMLFLGQLVVYIPLACLAGILMSVAWHMSEWRTAVSLTRQSRGTALVMLVTFVLTVFVDLTVAIEIGLILAMFVFIRSMSMQTTVSLVAAPEDDGAEPDYADAQSAQRALPKGAILYEINGPLFFGAVYKFREALAEMGRAPRVMVLHLKNVPVVDSSGVQALKESIRSLRAQGAAIILCGLQPHVYATLDRAGLLAALGDENLCATLPLALDRAGLLAAQKKKI